MKFNKKGQVFSALGGLAIGVVTLAIVLVVTFLILSKSETQIGTIEGSVCDTSKSFACNGTAVLTNAVADIPGWVPLIVIAVIGGVLLSLVSLFRSRQQ